MDVPKPSSRRLPDLDGLRGIAVCLVLMWHFIGCLVDRSNPTGDALYVMTMFGRTGVDLFFVLSGFLIIGILIDNKDATEGSFFRTFYARRIGRIFPAYFLLVAIYWALYWLTGPNYAFNSNSKYLPQIVYQIAFFFNWLQSFTGTGVARGFEATWSVSLEEQFYLLIPFIVWVSPIRRLPIVLISLGLCSALLRGFFEYLRPAWGIDWNLTLYTLPIFRLDTLCVGGLIAFAWRNEKTVAQVRRRAARLNLVAALLFIPVPVLLVAEQRFQAFHMNMWGHAYLVALYGTILACVLAQPQKFTFLSARPLQFCGKISYGVYLFHGAFISTLFIAAGRSERISSIGDVGLAICALMLTFIFAYWSFVSLEAPIRRFSHKWRYERSAPLRHAPPISDDALKLKPHVVANINASDAR